MKRRASADEVFQLFDQKIEDYLRRNRKPIETEYKSALGRPVEDGEVDAFISGLGDSLYGDLKLDPQHLARFVDFYVSDDKLGKAVSDAVESASLQHPRAASGYGPSRAASDIRAIADAVDSARRPSASKLASAIDAVLRRL